MIEVADLPLVRALAVEELEPTTLVTWRHARDRSRGSGCALAAGLAEFGRRPPVLWSRHDLRCADNGVDGRWCGCGRRLAVSSSPLPLGVTR